MSLELSEPDNSSGGGQETEQPTTPAPLVGGATSHPTEHLTELENGGDSRLDPAGPEVITFDLLCLCVTEVSKL